MKLLKAVRLSFQEVFSTRYYLLISIILSLIAFAASMWITNVRLIMTIIGSPLFSTSDKALLLFHLLGGITTNVELLGALLIVTMSVLFGINAALLMYAFTRKRSSFGISGANGTAAASAVFSAFLGAGCASCGTYILGAVLSSFGASWLIAFLPFAGQEFLFFSIILLLLSIFWLSKGIQAKNVC